jgi:hypothetical protein
MTISVSLRSNNFEYKQRISEARGVVNCQKGNLTNSRPWLGYWITGIPRRSDSSSPAQDWKSRRGLNRERVKASQQCKRKRRLRYSADRYRTRKEQTPRAVGREREWEAYTRSQVPDGTRHLLPRNPLADRARASDARQMFRRFLPEEDDIAPASLKNRSPPIAHPPPHLLEPPRQTPPPPPPLHNSNPLRARTREGPRSSSSTSATSPRTAIEYFSRSSYPSGTETRAATYSIPDTFQLFIVRRDNFHSRSGWFLAHLQFVIRRSYEVERLNKAREYLLSNLTRSPHLSAPLLRRRGSIY